MKKGMYIIMALMLVLTLSGCGNKEEKKSADITEYNKKSAYVYSFNVNDIIKENVIEKEKYILQFKNNVYSSTKFEKIFDNETLAQEYYENLKNKIATIEKTLVSYEYVDKEYKDLTYTQIRKIFMPVEPDISKGE